MTAQTVEFFWDLGSPYTYLASQKLDELAERTGAEIRWRPFLLGGVFQATGNQAPARIAAKAQYMLGDLELWSRYYGVPLTMPSHFPINSLLPMRAAVVCQEQGCQENYGNAVMRRYWAESGNPSDEAQLADVLRDLGMQPEDVLARTREQTVKDALRAHTEEAVQRGAFGAPTFFVGDRMFWGNDRLPLVEAYLRGELST